jgi:hypothetical protein
MSDSDGAELVAKEPLGGLRGFTATSASRALSFLQNKSRQLALTAES